MTKRGLKAGVNGEKVKRGNEERAFGPGEKGRQLTMMNDECGMMNNGEIRGRGSLI